MSSTAPADGPRRAAVLGSPIVHSRSPQLHLAAYRALGLTDWTYERIECTADELPSLVRGLGPEWVGLSVTMPGKFAALAFADEHTTRAALVGLAELGAAEVSIVSRDRDKAEPLLALGSRVGVIVRWVALGTPLDAVDVVVNTLPARVAAEHAETVSGASLLLDAIYDPWPTPLAETVAAAGGSVVSGLDMLLHQAFAQVEQFTGCPAPKEAMSAALG